MLLTEFMTEKRLIRRTKLGAVAIAAALLFSHMLWQLTEASVQQPGRPFDLVGYQTPMNERPGIDDGAVMAIHFSGDIHGALEPCG